jgi:hypothetical protein
MTSIPIIRFFEWDTAELASPIGQRNIIGGAFAFKQVIASGCQTWDPMNPTTTSGTLTFADVKFNLVGGDLPSHKESKVTAMTINLGSSGVAISDLKLYLTEDSGLLASKDVGLDPAFIQIATSGSWLPNPPFPSGLGTRLTTTIPSSPNVKRQDGNNALVAEDDLNSSEFIYMNVVVPLGHPLGTFGICGSGNIRMALMFDYWPNDYLLGFP